MAGQECEREGEIGQAAIRNIVFKTSISGLIWMIWVVVAWLISEDELEREGIGVQAGKWVGCSWKFCRFE